jgi:hypothetical protein
MSDVRSNLIEKIKVLNTVWENQADQPTIDAWLDNFRDAAVGPADRQDLHALYLLSRFMYFGRDQMRELLRALYRDLYRYRITESIRRTNGDTTDESFLREQFSQALARTRFLGVGNPSESGTHLLYYFRQENRLAKNLFINTHNVFDRAGSKIPVLRDQTVNRYVFIDDFCGSGDQGVKYSSEIVEDIKRLNPVAEVAYYVLFATNTGLDHVRQNTAFDIVDAVFELDETYQCFGASSRYFGSPPSGVDRTFAKGMAYHYGATLVPAHPLGYMNCQLLIGFYHNTPDNTLPIVWFAEGNPHWVALFRRYPKLYGAGSP